MMKYKDEELIAEIILKHLNNELYWHSENFDSKLQIYFGFVSISSDTLAITLFVYSTGTCNLIVSYKGTAEKIGHYSSSDYPQLNLLFLTSVEIKKIHRQEKLKTILQKETVWTKLKALISRT